MLDSQQHSTAISFLIHGFSSMRGWWPKDNVTADTQHPDREATASDPLGYTDQLISKGISTFKWTCFLSKHKNI